MHYFSSTGSWVRELRYPQIPDFLYLAIMTLTTVSTTVLYCDGTLIGNPTPGIQWYNFRPPGVTPNREWAPHEALFVKLL